MPTPRRSWPVRRRQCHRERRVLRQEDRLTREQRVQAVRGAQRLLAPDDQSDADGQRGRDRDDERHPQRRRPERVDGVEDAGANQERAGERQQEQTAG